MNGSADAEFEAARRIASVMPDAIPPVFCHGSVIGLQWIDGPRLNAAPDAGACRAAGAWLRRLHDATPAPPQVLRMDAVLAGIEPLVPADGADLARLRTAWPRLVARLRRIDGTAIPTSLGFLDYKPGNILLTEGGVAPLDCPDVRFAPRSYDILHFTAYLRLVRACAGHDLRPERHAFRAGYGQMSVIDDACMRILADVFALRFWLQRLGELAARPDYAWQMPLLRARLERRGLLDPADVAALPA